LIAHEPEQHQEHINASKYNALCKAEIKNAGIQKIRWYIEAKHVDRDQLIGCGRIAQ